MNPAARTSVLSRMPIAPLESLPRADVEMAAAALGGAVALAALLAWVWRWQRRRRARNARMLAITACGFDHLQDVLVPDGQGGALHVDFLLLTVRGVVVIDLRDVVGNIFGGDQMTAWTVMNRAQRYTFPNPQTALYDRIAAVRTLAQDLPVEGRVVFSGRGRFPKGLPRYTLTLESLPAEFPRSDRDAIAELLEQWTPLWEQLKKTVMPSRSAPKLAL